jgi:tetratricopeptide (TPR) repeat protein
MLKQDFEKSLVDELFEASYDTTLTRVNKNEAREKLKARLNEFIDGINIELSGDKLVRKLNSRLKGSLFRRGYMECKEHALFGIDFALERKGNCVVYASVIVSALEYMGRKDVIEKLRVKYTHDHIWLVYKDDSYYFEIYVNGRKSDEEHDIKAIISANWNNKGGVLLELGRYEDAIICFDKALEINPKNSSARENKGVAFSKLGRYEDAIVCYTKSLEIDPKSSNAWYNKGIALYKLGRYEDAIICFDKALEIDPKNSNAWYSKGLALSKLGRDEEAMKCKEKAAEIDPRYSDTWW